MMKQENAIEVYDIHKSFKIYSDRGHSLKEALFFSKRNKYEIRHVINGISFSVKKGEAIGLIGHNGCGKSTTLKMLTKIMYPDSGEIKMRGRVSSLIELGAGFHPEMTGRENIYINASIFGLAKREIDRRIDDIISFSELEEFIDNPVRTYSSGMYMRLAFAVAINVNADILLIDEILAVGDAGFQTKCFNRLKEIKAKGTTIVIVSHSLGQIEQICERSIWIKDGKIEAEGKPREVHPLYMEYMVCERQERADKEAERNKQNSEKDENEKKQNILKESEQYEQERTIDIKKKSKDEANKEKQLEGEYIDQKISREAENKKRWGNGKGKIHNLKMLHAENDKQSNAFSTGEKICIKFDYELSESIQDANVGFGIARIDGVDVYATNTRIDRVNRYTLGNKGSICVYVDKLLILPGHYHLDVAIEDENDEIIDFWREAYEFDVFSTIPDVGIARIDHTWKINNE